MRKSACLRRLEKDLGRELTEQELSDAGAYQERARKAAAAKGRDDETAVVAEMRAIKTSEDVEALAAERAAKMTKLQSLRLEDRIRAGLDERMRQGKLYADAIDDVIESLLVGSNAPIAGARQSVASRQKALEDGWRGGFLADVKRAGLEPLLTVKDPDFNARLRKELWAQSDASKGDPGLTGDGMARTLAEIMHKYSELARAEQNDAGAWIGRHAGYIVRQNWDSARLRVAGKESFVARAAAEMDWRRAFGGELIDATPEARAQALAGVYDGLVSGVHLEMTENGPTVRGASGFMGSNLAKSASHERVLVFKDADAWGRMNDAFGRGDIRIAFIEGLAHQAKRTALMQTMGPNPRHALEQAMARVMMDYRESAGRESARWGSNWLEARLMQLDGRGLAAGNQTAADIMAGARGVEAVSKLGAAVLSSAPDLNTYALAYRREGRDFIQGLFEAVENLFHGRGSAERQIIGSILGANYRGMIGQMAISLGADAYRGPWFGQGVAGFAANVRGLMARASQAMMKYNGLNWWTDVLSAGYARSQSVHLSHLIRGAEFSDLNPQTQAMLRRYDISAADWAAAKSGPHVEIDGATYFTPGDWTPAEGATPAQRRDLVELREKWRTLMSDSAAGAVLEAGARERAWMYSATTAGTVSGEVLRSIAQFKGYGAAYMNRVVGAHLFANGKADVAGLIAMVTVSTMLGMLSLWMKDLAAGRKPRDPFALTRKGDALWPKFLGAAMLQGGGFGLIGDFLFAETNRFGGSPIESMAGPLVGSAASLVKIIQKGRFPDEYWNNGKSALGGDLVGFAQSHTPFANLFYLKGAFDWFFWNHLKEMSSPGYMNRLYRRAREERGQEYWLKY